MRECDLFDDDLVNDDSFEKVFNLYRSRKRRRYKLVDKLSGNGCIGALVFYGKAIGAFGDEITEVQLKPFLKAETAFMRMVDNDIVGEDLFILWNDCCNLDTGGAVQVMLDRDIEDIKSHINKGGKPIPYTKEEMSLRKAIEKDGQHWSFYIMSGEYKGMYVNIKGNFYNTKKIFEEKYGDINYTMTPFEVMEAAICDPERFAPAPQLLEEIE